MLLSAVTCPSEDASNTLKQKDDMNLDIITIEINY